jgi:hypothetical protein
MEIIIAMITDSGRQFFEKGIDNRNNGSGRLVSC